MRQGRKMPGMNRPEVMRNEHLRTVLRTYTTRTIPLLKINDYAQQVYQANRAAGL
ncbi:antitoxin [Mycolicibacterium novocastrense]|uniref:Antitoxin n=1 Tax=Mycolicibacterium novocastrense TaxID=59813 RepID=A0AAW5SUA4_MYCNV|nr:MULTISPECIES: antitoxin [Mycolicibacterium]MCV7026647.1 antitoxin [Mycolicibacterium novocastrense]MDX1887519.1 antitoxin [Mycolicibacterium sp. 120270]GAT07598.1 CopG domain-containing protein [Mycolicibacterium novocastrense]